jgi:hypothetical protein
MRKTTAIKITGDTIYFYGFPVATLIEKASPSFSSEFQQFLLNADTDLEKMESEHRWLQDRVGELEDKLRCREDEL